MDKQRGDFFNEITKVCLQNTTNSSLMNGVIIITARGKQCVLGFPFKQKTEAEEVLTILQNNCANVESIRVRKENVDIVYHINGVRGKSIKFFADRCIIKVTANFASFLTGNSLMVKNDIADIESENI